MYTPPHFQVHELEALHALIREHSLGLLISHGTEGLDANHLPLELEDQPAPQGRLIGHVARANPLWQQLRDGDPVLVVFRAEDGYISPNWYPSKADTHRQVPTWNYRAVHAHGYIRIHDEERFVRGVLAKLTRRHEQQANPDNAWRMGDAPTDYLQQMLSAVVGIEIVLERLEGKFKLSQNKAAGDIQGAADALVAAGKPHLAQQMQALNTASDSADQ